MKKNPHAASRVRRLNARQRKKHYVGEFREHLLRVECVFHGPLSQDAHAECIGEFFGFLEQRGLMGGGFGGRMPLVETDGIIARIARGSPAQEDREAVVAWLRAHPAIVAARALADEDNG